MIQVKQDVKNICSKIWQKGYSQIVIDLIQDDIEELIEDEIDRDKISCAAYRCSLLLQVLNPILVKDIELLTELIAALDNWTSAHEFANRALGLPPEM
jgi:hypothetical protein